MTARPCLRTSSLALALTALLGLAALPGIHAGPLFHAGVYAPLDAGAAAVRLESASPATRGADHVPCPVCLARTQARNLVAHAAPARSEPARRPQRPSVRSAPRAPGSLARAAAAPRAPPRPA